MTTERNEAKASGPTPGPQPSSSPSSLFHAVDEFRPATNRGVDDAASEADTWPADSVIEIELEGGVRLRTTLEQFEADFVPAPQRGADGKEGRSRRLPRQLPLGAGERGLAGWAISAYRLLSPAGSSGEKLARIAAAGIEAQVAGHLGLRRLSFESEHGLQALDEPAGEFDPTKPILLFLHGTASSTTGSFGELWTPTQAAVRQSLHKEYGINVAAFEHRTLTESPIQNALALAQELPAGAKLHLVSHSRGGLIGELLCRSGVQEQAEPFSEADFKLLETESSREELRALNAKLLEKRLVIERFVRVACPARGTTLASRRLDLYFSTLANLLRLTLPIGGALSATFEALVDFAGAVAKERTDPKALPGLEAMMPESAFIRMLNRPGLTVKADLTVLAGDAEGEGLLRRLGLLMMDLFYREDHDFVVNTRSMYGGATRANNQSRFFFDQGPDVSHFHYFRNTDTTRRLLSGLVRSTGFESGFAPLAGASREIRLSARRGTEPPRPPLLVLPGIMGSQLGVRTGKGIDLVWLDYLDLARGGLPRRLCIEATDVMARDPLPNTYGRLMEFLHTTHEVVPFGYDWRRSLREEAARLGRELERQLDIARRSGQPVRILAHSMGGLLFRAVVCQRPDLWSRMLEHRDARVVLLGTPFSGSHAITRLLCGQEPTLKALALLDLEHNQRELLQTIAAFPGVLELLPDDNDYAYFQPEGWKPIAEAIGDGFVTPKPAALAAALKLRRELHEVALDPGRIVYVAGLANETPTRLDVVKAGKRTKVVFQRTSQGDGRVPWATIPAGLTKYYLAEAHGDLPDHETAFPALLDLLNTGQTNRLSTQPPALARGGDDREPMREGETPYLPDATTLEQIVRGGSTRRRRAESLPRIQIGVVHGDLSESRAPVLVGHYIGDSIISAESALDRMHGGRLRGRHQLGQYPGPIGTAEVFLCDDHKVPGAIVVGLGAVGELTPGALVTAVAAGLQRYAALVAEDAAARPAAGVFKLRVAALLVGTCAGGLGVADAVLAILRGTRQAALVLRQSCYGTQVQFERLEIAELYEDRAIQSAHALQRLGNLPEFRQLFEVDATCRSTETGWRRAAFQESQGWWGRLQVTGEPDGSLKFLTLTDRARAPVQLQAVQRPLIDRFVQEAIASVNTDTALCQTLFDLLLPQELKARAPEQTNLVLVVDEHSARYPWELMRDRLNQSDEPLVVERGVIRQLQTTEYRRGVHNARTTEALVVGDPISKFPALPGAQAEAGAIAQLLLKGGAGVPPFNVTTKIQANASEIVRELFARDYRILHLAGHGVYEYPVEVLVPDGKGSSRTEKRLTTGMVLGDDVFLTPAEVSQMRTVPELVFINCCHLGRIEPGSTEERNKRNAWYAPHRLAANLATEFIRMGVRAVVASGWAVHDGAGLTFSQAFYHQLLAGASFGNAVRLARREAWEGHPGVNTWGAFQCYGDPDYRLGRDDGIRGMNADRPAVSPAEVIAELESLRRRSRDPEALKSIEAALDRIERTARQSDWSGDARLRMTLGLACYSVNRLEQAREHLLVAVASESLQLSLEAIEKLANTEVKLAADPQPTGGGKGRSVQARRALAKQAIQRLDRLVVMAPNTERYALLGSAWKRLAQVEKDKDQACRNALRSMAAAYTQALTQTVRTGASNAYYPQLNALAASVAATWLEPKSSARRTASSGLEEALQAARRSAAEEAKAHPSFWNRVTDGDAELLLLLAGPKRTSRPKVIKAYLDAARRGIAPNEKKSVYEHLDFLTEMAKAGGNSAAMSDLKAVRAELEQAWG